MQLIFTKDDGGVYRGKGFISDGGTSDDPDEKLVNTTMAAIESTINQAQGGEEKLNGTQKTTNDALEEPLVWLDYLMFKDGDIEFDNDHSR